MHGIGAAVRNAEMLQLGGRARLRALVKGLGSNVSTIGPHDRIPVEKEALKVFRLLEWLKDRAFQPPS